MPRSNKIHLLALNLIIDNSIAARIIVKAIQKIGSKNSLFKMFTNVAYGKRLPFKEKDEFMSQ